MGQRLGLTTIADVGGVLFADWVYPADLWRAGALDIRLRQFFTGFDFPTLDGLKNFINYNHNLIGDDMLRVVGVGERLTAGSPSAATVAEALQFFGEKGWTFCVHSLSLAENQMHVDALKAAAQTFDVAKLRWQLHHLNDMPANLLAELAALKVPVGIQGWRYTSASGGSPWRTALDLGLIVGAGTDATNVAAQNPWLVIYHMVTGRNNAGTVTNAGQQITRLEALRMYTLGSAYLTRDEDDLGSIEEGKLADLVVLNDNYLKVPDEQIKKLGSDLTFVGGRVVHAAGRYRVALDDHAQPCADTVDDGVRVRHERVLERGGVGDRGLAGGDDPGVVEVVQALLGDRAEQAGGPAAGARALLDREQAVGLLDRREDGLEVERAQRAQVDHLGVDRRAARRRRARRARPCRRTRS